MSDKHPIIERDFQPYLFFIDIDYVDNVDLTSYIRNIQFYRDEMIITYIDTEDDFVYRSFSAHHSKPWLLHYIDGQGKIATTYKILNDSYSPVLKLPLNLDQSVILTNVAAEGRLSIAVEQYIRVIPND